MTTPEPCSGNNCRATLLSLSVSHHPKPISTFLYLLAVMLAFATAACVMPSFETKPVVPALIKIEVTDPAILRLMEVTQRLEMKASGTLRAGTYEVEGKALHIKKPTDFSLQMSLPITDPHVITTEHASGKLSIGDDVTFAGLTVPHTIELHEGKASTNVDLLKVLGSYLINVLHDQEEGAKEKDVRQIVGMLAIQSANLQLKPNSFLKFDQKVLHIGNNSNVELKDLTLDTQLDYVGKCAVNINFMRDCNWVGERVDCLFNGGSCNLTLTATRTSGNVELSLDGSKPAIGLLDSTFRFGREKRSSAHTKACSFKPDKLIWQKAEGAERSTLHVKTPMNLKETDLFLKTTSQETQAHFDALIPAKLAIDVTEKDRETKFATLKPEVANHATVTITRPKTHVGLKLSNATIDKIEFDKKGDIEFNMSKGTANLDELTWGTGHKGFSLITKGHSLLSLPEGMNLSLNRDHEQTRMVLPITVKLGAATFAGPVGTMRLSDLNGALMIVLDPDVHITSEMDFTIDQSSLLGAEQATIKAKGLDISSADGVARAHIKQCTVLLSQAVLGKAIIQKLPKEKIFHPDKIISERKWRYRDATVKTVYMRNIKVDKLDCKDANTFDFSAKADLEAQGTIDKGSLLAVIKKDVKTETKQWSATATVVGKGDLNFTLIPNDSLAMSEISYKADVDMGFGDDINLDWSQVTGGLAEAAEKKVIVGHLKKIDMPLSFDGKLKLFRDNGDKWKLMKISKFTVTPVGTDAQLSFSADIVP